MVVSVGRILTNAKNVAKDFRNYQSIEISAFNRGMQDATKQGRTRMIKATAAETKIPATPIRKRFTKRVKIFRNSDNSTTSSIGVGVRFLINAALLRNARERRPKGVLAAGGYQFPKAFMLAPGPKRPKKGFAVQRQGAPRLPLESVGVDISEPLVKEWKQLRPFLRDTVARRFAYHRENQHSRYHQRKGNAARRQIAISFLRGAGL